jgi:hypothetical protein
MQSIGVFTLYWRRSLGHKKSRFARLFATLVSLANKLHQELSNTQQGAVHRIVYPMRNMAGDYVLPSMVTGVNLNEDEEITDI